VRLDGPGGTFNTGYVGNHYTFWHVAAVDSAFTPRDAEVTVTGNGCHGELRLVGTESTDYFEGVAAGPMPGSPVIGQRITRSMGLRLAVVLTPSGLGTCQATRVRIASQSWLRTRWTDLPVGLAVNVTHRAGADDRSRDFHPPR
jgi:hypothetical protein